MLTEKISRHGAAAKVFETVSSLLFIAEYITRFAVAGERAKYRGTAGGGASSASWASIVDLCSFMPWIAEKLIYWGEDGDVPSTAYVRAFSVLRILKTDRFTGAADALGQVFYVNMHILGVAGCCVSGDAGAFHVVVALLLRKRRRGSNPSRRRCTCRSSC